MPSAAATATTPPPPLAPPVPAPANGAGSPAASRTVEPISVAAVMFVLVTALLIAIASLIDVLINGWLSAFAHLAWAAGVFVTVGLLLGLVVSVVSQLRRTHAASTPPTALP
ncbi:hypothetical protein AB0M58_14130 [Streptomyces bobili]|uniref:hypothetical protein n=1 Tax=Streptomyces bobili TaxID=67280 RepID=UPI00344AFB1D